MPKYRVYFFQKTLYSIELEAPHYDDALRNVFGKGLGVPLIHSPLVVEGKWLPPKSGITIKEIK